MYVSRDVHDFRCNLYVIALFPFPLLIYILIRKRTSALEEEIVIFIEATRWYQNVQNCIGYMI